MKDVRLDIDRINRERQRRAWSQQQFADIAGISLRTIQRLEKSGRASKESARALAAALACDVSELLATDQPTEFPRWKIPALVIGTAGLCAVIGGFYLLGRTDDGVLLSYVLEERLGEDLNRSEVNFLMGVNEEATADIKGNVKLLFNTRDRGDHLELGIKLYKYLNEFDTGFVGYNIGSVKFDSASSFSWTSDTGSDYFLTLTPARHKL